MEQGNDQQILPRAQEDPKGRLVQEWSSFGPDRNIYLRGIQRSRPRASA